MPEPNATTPTKGTLPKNLQLFGLLGLGALILGVVIFSPTPKKNANADAQAAEQTAALKEAASVAERQLKAVEEARQRAEQEALNAQTQQRGDDALLEEAAVVLPAQEADPLEAERRKHEYQAQFASQIALSYRNNPTGQPPSIQPTPEPGTPDAEIDALQRDLKTTTSDAQAAILQAAALAQAAQAQTPAQQTGSAGASGQLRRSTTARNATRIRAKVHTIFEGTVIEAALVNRLAGEFAGPVMAITTAPVYSRNRQALLLPTGTKLLGEAKRVETQNQERLAVAFHRALMPDSYSIDLDQFAGLDGLGETALRDKVNRHYLRTFGTSIMLGLLGGLSSITSDQTAFGLPASATDRYQQGVGATLGQEATSYLSSRTNLMPTITIREGHRIRVLVAQDFRVPAYADHDMDPAI